MKVYRIKISSLTASFRYPNFILGFQPTLEVPPLSTVLGLISAAAGRYIAFKQLEIGYYFEFSAKATDLEKIYQIGLIKGKNSVDTKGITSNVINREFLFDCQLIIYVKDEELMNYFRKPVYQLVLGRSSDLATVTEIKEVDIEPVEEAECLAGQIVPFTGVYLPGEVMALPKYYTGENPRQILGTEIYTIIPYHKPMKVSGIETFVDYFEIDEVRVKPSELVNGRKQLNIYFHKLNFSHYDFVS